MIASEMKFFRGPIVIFQSLVRITLPTGSHPAKPLKYERLAVDISALIWLVEMPKRQYTFDIITYPKPVPTKTVTLARVLNYISTKLDY